MSAESTQRTRTTQRNNLYILAFVSLVSFVSAQRRFEAQSADEATRLLSEYVAIDTSNPPGDTRKAADFLASVLDREGIPVTRYESAPAKKCLR